MKNGIRCLLALCALLCLFGCGKREASPAPEASVSYADPEQMLTPEKLEHRDCETLGHVLSVPTCQKPATCYYCGHTEGELGAHDWTHATCRRRSTCTVCGAEQGELADHLFTEASCAGPASCVYCGLTTGEAKAHSFRGATCVSPSMCSVCMKKQGAALGHTWTEGSCTVDKVCTRCGRRQTAPGHRLEGGSCTEDSVCAVCGWHEPAKGHSFDENGVCTRCGKSRSAALQEEKTRTTEPASEEPTTALDVARLQSWNNTLAQLLETSYTKADEALDGGDFEQDKETAAEAAAALAEAVDLLKEMQTFCADNPELAAVSAQAKIIRNVIEDASKTKEFYESTFSSSVQRIRRASYDAQQILPKLVKAISALEKTK